MMLSWDKIYNVLRSFNITFWNLDYSYEVLTNDISYRFVNAVNDYNDLLNKYMLRYTPEVFDCDDFAWLFKAVCSMNKFACGFAIGLVDEQYGHAFNVIPYLVNDRLVLLLIEPQLVRTVGIPFLKIMDSNPTQFFGLGKYRVLEVVM